MNPQEALDASRRLERRMLALFRARGLEVVTEGRKQSEVQVMAILDCSVGVTPDIFLEVMREAARLEGLPMPDLIGVMPKEEPDEEYP